MRFFKAWPWKVRTTAFVIMFSLLTASSGWCAENSSVPNDLLLNLFIEKGYVSKQEAQKIEKEAAKRQAELERFKSEAEHYKTELDHIKTDMAELKARSVSYQTNLSGFPPQTKWLTAKGVKSIELFGDARVRYEARSAEDPSGNKISLNRERYALRFGLRGKAFDGVNYGFRLETSANPRSTWVSMGTSSSSSAYQGPFGKSSASIAIGQVYLGWAPEKWINITLGKMPNPLYTTTMVWDSDLNPEGAAERFNYTVGEADLFANFGQFLYADFNPYTASGGLGINGITGQSANNIFMFAWQGGLNYHITTNTSAKIAATVYNYTGLQRSSANSGTTLSPYFGDPYVGEGAYYYYGGISPHTAPGDAGYVAGKNFNLPNGGYGSVSYPFNQAGLNDLLVVEVPFELNFNFKKIAARLYGDVAYNLNGAQRAREAANAYSYILTQNPSGTATARTIPAQTHDVKAYRIGLAIASSGNLDLLEGGQVRKHAWELSTFWQHTEQYALDPNLIDSDIFEGRENLQGICVALAYGFTDNLIGSIRYAHASRINNLLGTGGSNQDLPQMNPINSLNMFQVDLGLKF